MPPLSACSTAADAASAGRDMAGKTVVITGGAAGIGAEAARVLAGQGAKVIIGCRSVAAGQKVADQAKAEGAKVGCWGVGEAARGPHGAVLSKFDDVALAALGPFMLARSFPRPLPVLQTKPVPACYPRNSSK